MTDNDIMKALRCCSDRYCKGCSEQSKANCRESIAALAWDLIYRQKEEIEHYKKAFFNEQKIFSDQSLENECMKAEIDRLKKDNEYILMQHKFQRRPSGDCWNDVIEKAKAEAIKEFAERLKAFKIKPEFPWDDFFVTEGAIDNLVKEMTGEKT